MKGVRRLALGVWLLAAAGCDVVSPRPVVTFRLDASFCGLKVPVIFSIDNLEVGQDTFVVGYPTQHLTPRGFETSAGEHILGARSIGLYVWPDKTVTLDAGTAFIDSLPLYCS